MHLYLWQSISSQAGAGLAECAYNWCSSRWRNPAAPLFQPAPHSKTGAPLCSTTPSLGQGTEWKMTLSSFKLWLVMVENCALDWYLHNRDGSKKCHSSAHTTTRPINALKGFFQIFIRNFFFNPSHFPHEHSVSDNIYCTPSIALHYIISQERF